MTKQINTREIILDVLLAVTRDGAFCHIVCSDVLNKYGYLDKRDRSFISRVCHGTLERMPELDGIINQFSTIKVSKMKPVIRCILRSALYQMLYMDSVPDSAACNEAVKLAGKRGFQNLKGFVNGVLRNISRNKNEIKYPEKTDFRNYMEKRYSILPWMTDLWEESLTREEIEELAEAFLVEGPTCVRVSTGKITAEELTERLRKEDILVEKSERYEDVLYLSGYDSLSRIPEFQNGLFTVQDISSMEVGRLLDPKAGETGIDVCAAPGGKSIHVAQLMKEGQVYARDLTQSKVALITDNLKRMGIDIVVPQCMDATVLDETMLEKADFVIADLPCSGLGVLGKKPDIKYHTSLEKVQKLAAMQRQILDVVCRYVKPGGRMVYSTCTINHLENQDNTAWFLENHPEFTKVEETQLLAREGRQDGFYYALLKKGV
ncbi:MAG: 16S rRNA (cytosine(967)-C(5))-methyltransferase RsmB [Lachnospiraceae bacterium]